MPRPDIANLGLAYRRIPIMAIGRDIFLDTRIIFERLEELPNVASPPLGATTPDNKALQRFFYDYTTDYGIFRWLALALITSDLPIAQDQSFLEDRKDYCGTETLVDGDPKAVHAECLREFAGMFAFYENLLSDGREYVFKTKTPSLGDIEAIWPTLFTAGMDGLLPKDQFSAEKYPKVYSWHDRFKAAVTAAEEKQGKQPTIEGDDALKAVTSAEYHDKALEVDSEDFDVKALGLSKGDLITVGPTDFGLTKRDKGKLVGINKDEVVIETSTSSGGSIRAHAPRHSFRILKA